ncbi:SpdD protein [Peterkaempfera bronchialis]|uniref:SpdD protein n=1 Tax=Peterkaempfera bronchialis TaxID=2126346 RepID=UPI003C2D4FF0
MLRPKLPDTPTYVVTTAQHHTPVPPPASRRPLAPYVATGAGAVAAVVAVGVVLTALLAAVAVTAVSVAVCAAVLRSLLAPNHRRR